MKRVSNISFARFRGFSNETKNLWFYCVHLHNPREPVPSPAGYARHYECSPSSVYAAYAALKDAGILIDVYEQGDLYTYLNPVAVWNGNEQSRQIQMVKLNKMAAELADRQIEGKRVLRR